MKISIIGSNGLLSDSIGRHCEKQGTYLDVYGLYEPQRHSFDKFYSVDLVNDVFDFTQIKESDIIVYAVGAGIQSNLKESADLIYNLNVNIPVKICNYLKTLDYKGVFITFGSYFEIGENVENKIYTEDDVLCSKNKVPNDYSISKRMLSRFVSSFVSSFKIWHFILPTIYGESESPHRLIPYTINALKNNADLQFTSGEQIRQYIYIDEIPTIIHLAFEKKLDYGIYNVSGNETLTVKELVAMLFGFHNRTLPESVFGIEQRADVGMKVLQLDGSKLQKILDYVPNYKIENVYGRY